ncbi:DUF7109 family protein [Halorarius halobius]|uniref:DUF7109 family protein n=1 Tax=Halorarius halobius TaxID=2962671 RepID=UPI0020CE3F26|nr:hypothetical protein [Halorarius halobius]
MNLDTDEVAGIVDLFGALSRAELDEALSELAYRRDADPPDGAVEAAVDAYAVVAFETAAFGDEGTYLAVGPAAFPTLPEGATDLPHILDVDSRTPDREALAAAVESRFRGDVARAVAADDAAEMRRLLDVSYDLEAWGPVELADMRARLDDALEGAN